MLGEQDRILRRLQEKVRSQIVARGNEILIEGPIEEEQPLRRLFKDLESMAKIGPVENGSVDTAVQLAGLRGIVREQAADTKDGIVAFERAGFIVRARSANQENYILAARSADLTFAVGPAGTGKTYLAVAMAVKAFSEGEVDRIILVRPAVEAGEQLGFLPGDFREKVDPYFRPLYDALLDMLSPDKLKRFMDQEKIEVAPLAYMRGRTLSNSFVILDEAQNTTNDQMKMFLTRLGKGSRAIVTGDLTQTDLKNNVASGLAEAIRILREIKGIKFVSLDKSDVVRHGLVREIIRAYASESDAGVE